MNNNNYYYFAVDDLRRSDNLTPFGLNFYCAGTASYSTSVGLGGTREAGVLNVLIYESKMSDSSGQFLFASAANGEVFFWSLDGKNKDLRKQRELLVFQGSPSGDSEPDSVASLSWNDDSILLCNYCKLIMPARVCVGTL